MFCFSSWHTCGPSLLNTETQHFFFLFLKLAASSLKRKCKLLLLSYSSFSNEFPHFSTRLSDTVTASNSARSCQPSIVTIMSQSHKLFHQIHPHLTHPLPKIEGWNLSFLWFTLWSSKAITPLAIEQLIPLTQNASRKAAERLLYIQRILTLEIQIRHKSNNSHSKKQTFSQLILKTEESSDPLINRHTFSQQPELRYGYEGFYIPGYLEDTTCTTSHTIQSQAFIKDK